MSIDRPCIRIKLGQGIHARLIRRLIGQARDQLLGRRQLDGRVLGSSADWYPGQPFPAICVRI
jgi:hypothetical protein